MEESETSETSETTESTESTRAKPRDERISRALKRARKNAGPDYDENQSQVRFRLEEARILAMLEVAGAVRGNQDEDEDEEA